MRPITIISLITGVIIGLVVLGGAVWALVDRNGGKFWFYWIAPVTVLSIGGILVMLAVQYWARVGRLETKGRPKSG